MAYKFAVIFLMYRIVASILIKTFFVPDEYWQSLEVAHYLIYGYGYLTWEWRKHVRSCVYPFIIAALYSILPDKTMYLIHAPRMLQAVLSSCGDYFTYRLAGKVFGNKAAKFTLLCILTSWFLLYCSARTLTNMTETSITSCGLYYYPWHVKHRTKSQLKWNYLWFIGLSVIIRPTSVILWIPLCLCHMWKEKHRLASLFVRILIVGTTSILLEITVDYFCFRKFVITPYQFFIFNWNKDIGSFYGKHPWHWYFTVGFPTVMGASLIPFVMSLKLPKARFMLYVILWFIIILSVPSHKELRFLLPIMPLCMCVCGATLAEAHNNRLRLRNLKLSQTAGICIILSLIFINIPIALYMGIVHQKGTINAVHYLSENITDDSNILFLMPCHSTPYYSHIHKNISMRFLTCEPNFDNYVNYSDEAEQFYCNPQLWLSRYFDIIKAEEPSHIVMFDNLYNFVSDLLMAHKYELCFRTYHAAFTQGRVGHSVYIYCKH